MLRKSVRYFTYALLWFIQVQCTFSSGLISVSAKSIKSEIGLMDLDYGMLSSMHAIGKVLGAFFFFSLEKVVHLKYLVMFVGIGKGLAMIFIGMSRNGPLILIIRLMSGFPHVIKYNNI